MPVGLTLPIPTRTNYRFDGWFDEATQYTNNTLITKNVTLEAKWRTISTPGREVVQAVEVGVVQLWLLR